VVLREPEPKKSMPREKRSGCPISICLELFGDRWTLLILRSIVFYRHRYFAEFLEAKEGIATNILAERLDRLERHGIVTKSPDPEDARRSLYALTEAGLDLIPILLEMTVWGVEHDPEANPHEERIALFKKDRTTSIQAHRDGVSVGPCPES